jgi:hypothetical protein
MIKAKGNDFDIYRRSWQIAIFLQESVIRMWQGTSEKSSQQQE